MIMIQLRFASLAAAAIVGAAQGAHASNAAPVIVFGTKLDCSSALERSPLAVATKSFGPKANAESLAWIDVQLNRVGVGAKPPIHPASQQIANLLRNGHVVAAKMVNDEASLGSEGYRATRWSSSIETLVTIMTQPVSHASYPTSVRAAGEVRNEAATSHATHGSDLEAASDSLAELLGRAALAKKALGTPLCKAVYALLHACQRLPRSNRLRGSF